MKPVAYKFPGPVPKEAVDFITRKGWKVGFNWQDVWREEHAVSFTVAKAMRMDVLTSIREQVERAVSEGITLQEFKKTLTPTLQNMGWWGRKVMEDPLTGETKEFQLGSPRRLKTIFDVNCRTARAAGQWQRFERTKKSLPYLLRELGSAAKHRPEHVAFHGTLLPIDDPFWNIHMPPDGYNCKCHVRQVSNHEKGTLKKTGIQDPEAPMERDPETELPTGRRIERMTPVKTEAPKIQYRNWKNKRTGEIMRVPVGVDPGFDSNPGKTRIKNALTVLDEKTAGIEPAILKTALKDIIGSPDYGLLVKGSETLLIKKAMELLGAKETNKLLAAAQQALTN